MKNESRKPAYVSSIILFTLSFGYYVLQCLWMGIEEIGVWCGFSFSNGLQQALNAVFLEETMMLPALVCRVLSVVLSIVLVAGFGDRFRLGGLLFTAAAPIVLPIISGIGKVTGALLEHFTTLHFYEEERILVALYAVLLVAYTVAFYIVLRWEWKHLPQNAE